MSSPVAKRYARALIEVAKERGLIDTVEADLKLVVESIQQSEELKKFLTHPKVEKEAKKELFSQLFEGKVTAETLNFLFVLIDNERETDLAFISAAFVSLANEERGIADAVITTAKPLSEEEQTELTQQFGASIGKKLRVQTAVDPSILGGVVVKIGDRLYDGSIKAKLEKFAHQF